MKVAVVGSRNFAVKDLGSYLPSETTEIISGGAKGVDACAKEYALSQKIKYTEFLPNYRRYKKGAPLKRNLEIIEYADFVLIFWDGESKGTKFVIDTCKNKGVEHKVFSDLDGLICLAFDEITEKELEEFLSLDVNNVRATEKLDRRIKNLLDEKFGKQMPV